MSNLTANDIKAATIFAKASIDSCGEFNEVENMSYYNAKDLADEIGLSLNAVGGVMTSLISKGLIVDECESSRGSEYNDFSAIPDVYLEFAELKHLVV